MNGKELLEKCPKAAEVIKQWYIAKMKADNLEFSNEFVNVMQEKIGRIIIDNNPRELFDVLDDNKIYINMYMGMGMEKDTVIFSYKIISSNYINTEEPIWYSYRKEAEKQAIIDAVTLLDNKLS